MIIEVAIDKLKYCCDRLYSYRVSDLVKSKVFVGMRVIVPFGRANSERTGIVMGIKEFKDTKHEIKDITTIVDENSVIKEESLLLAKYMKDNYYCTFFDAISAITPICRKLKLEKTLKINLNVLDTANKENFNAQELDFIEKIKKKSNIIKGNKYIGKIQKENKVLFDKFLKNGLFELKYEEKLSNRKKYTGTFKINNKITPNKLTKRQQIVYDFMQKQKRATIKEICYFTGETKSVIENLIKKEIIILTDEKNTSPSTSFRKKDKDLELSNAQKIVYDELVKLFSIGKFHVSLLKGITGSGKTMVLFSLIDFVLKKGKSIIFMVPEIALTIQFVNMFKEKYGDAVAVVHSGLADGERLKQWKRIEKGEIKVVVGTRTAVFAPLNNLGLIIMDEEHESTYKSEATPRFHARDIAIQRCKYNSAMLVLSSATPSLESYFFAKSGIYSLNVLNERYGDSVLPNTEIVDMNTQILNGNTTAFSSYLVEKTKEQIDKGKQAIFLLNRRGYNTFVRCSECKEVVMCPNCNIALNYHSANDKLMCHYCGYSKNFVKECPSCNGISMVYNGLGTQRAEFQLKKILPQARIVRIDADSVGIKGTTEKIFKEFSEGKYDIIIGTQMVAKGLNFPNVTLVGVLDADQALYADDFRSYERAFSLITQVSGRAGRGADAGYSIIQTYSPGNEIIKLAAKQDYEEFYDQEIEIRKALIYPPFSNICYIGFTGEKQNNVKVASNEFFEKLKDLAQKKYAAIPLRIFKPSAANINKICGKYRYRIVIKCKNNKTFRRMLSEIMLSCEKMINSKKVNVFIDMNPVFIG